MAQRPTMSRRRLLLGGGAVLLAAGLPSLGRVVVGAAEPAPQDLPARLRALVDGTAVRRLGRAYAATLPASADATGLALDLLPAGLSPEQALALPLEELRSRIVAAVEHDYRLGRVVAVGGWLLSPTEAGLCALHALH